MVLFIYSLQTTGGKVIILALLMDLLKSLTFIWRIFPTIGRGVGPGGSFPLACLWFHRKRKIKIERQITRTTKRSIGALCVRATESLQFKHVIKTKCKGKNKQTKCKLITKHAISLELLNKYCFIISALWLVNRYLNKRLH